MKSITEEIRKYVELECKKPTSKYGYEPYPTHFVPMVNHARGLAIKLKADLEVVELAAWLHDLGSIIYGRDNHHITGAKIAEKKLRELNYSPKKIKRVIGCIKNHRGSVQNGLKGLEEQIIADADGMAAFDRIEGLFLASLVYERKGQVEARKEVMGKLKRQYQKLSQEARELIKPKYEAALLLFN